MQFDCLIRNSKYIALINLKYNEINKVSIEYRYFGKQLENEALNHQYVKLRTQNKERNFVVFSKERYEMIDLYHFIKFIFLDTISLYKLM